jgi:hypothetical protein
MAETRDDALDRLIEVLDLTRAELAVLTANLLPASGEGMAEDELFRQVEVVRRAIIEAKLVMAWWDGVLRGEIVLEASPAGEIVATRVAPGTRPTLAQVTAGLAALPDEEEE